MTRSRRSFSLPVSLPDWTENPFSLIVWSFAANSGLDTAAADPDLTAVPFASA